MENVFPFTIRSGVTFTAKVLSVVRRIPTGRVASYGEVAAAAGRPRAARAVGNIMRDCRARDVPCHRVIAAAGRLGGYGGNLELKRALLRAEGLLVSRDRVRDYREKSAVAAWRHRRHGASPRQKGRTNSRLRALNQE